MKRLIDLGMKLWYDVKSPVVRSSSNVKEPTVTPSDLFELRKVIAAAELLKRGDFDAELSRMEEEAQKTVGVASAEATRIRQQADQYLDTVQTKIRALQESVDQAKEALAADRTKFLEEHDRLDQELEAKQLATRELAKKITEGRDLFTQRQIEFEQRVAEIDRKESNLDAQIARNTELQAELSDKLARLRGIAA